MISSPLLVRRARSSGGAGGIRVTLERDGGGFVVRSSGARSREHRVADALAAAQAFNAEVEAARRGGYTSIPEPALLSAEAVERAWP